MGGVHAGLPVGAGLPVPGIQQGASRDVAWDVRLAGGHA